MKENDQIEIPLSKKKMMLLLLCGLVLVLLGVLFMIYPNNFTSIIIRSTTVIFIVGLVCVLFFGFIVALLVPKFLDKSMGLIINDQGIIDNSSSVSPGLILWTDIKEIKVHKVASQKFLMLALKNPQDYINNETNCFKRKAMQKNYNRYGSPIHISSIGLKISSKDLQNLLLEKQKTFKS